MTREQEREGQLAQAEKDAEAFCKRIAELETQLNTARMRVEELREVLRKQRSVTMSESAIPIGTLRKYASAKPIRKS